MKHSGALMSSKFIPPQDLLIIETLSTNFLVFRVSISKSMPSISAKRLNNTAFPSITGFEARAPKLPSPKTADPLEITATIFPFAV